MELEVFLWEPAVVLQPPARALQPLALAFLTPQGLFTPRLSRLHMVRPFSVLMGVTDSSRTSSAPWLLQNAPTCIFQACVVLMAVGSQVRTGDTELWSTVQGSAESSEALLGCFHSGCYLHGVTFKNTYGNVLIEPSPALRIKLLESRSSPVLT